MAPVLYEITVEGNLDPGWSAWLEGMEISFTEDRGERGAATLTGRVADQATLRGLLNQLWDLNLTVLSVNRIDRL